MVKRAPAETTKWVAANLVRIKEISDVEILSDQVIRVSRTKYAPFNAGIVAVPRVEADHINPIIKSEFSVEIIANVPKEAFWTGEALGLAECNGIATGTLGDLYRGANLESVRDFRSPETLFIERGLRQHNYVTTFYRVHDRLYQIFRKDLPDLTVVMLNEYELTADHLRTARERYGIFSAAVITNPNGGATMSAEEAAAAMDAEILDWRLFMRRLTRE